MGELMLGKKKVNNMTSLAALLLVLAGTGCGGAVDGIAQDNLLTGILSNPVKNNAELERSEGNIAESWKSGEDAAKPEKPAAATVSYSYDGTVFEYDGTAYDMQERDSMINAIMDCIPVGEYIVIDSHTGPHNAIYTVFNTQTREFEKDIEGVLLTFYDDDIHTAVYAFWNDICAYDGTVLATLDIGQYDIIRDISFSEDHTQLKVVIYENGTDEQQQRVEFLQLPDFPD